MGQELEYLINQMQKTINCDAECQRKKKEAELLNDIEKAKTQAVDAPYALKAAQQKYAEFNGGPQALSEFNIQSYQTEADKMVDDFRKQQDAIISNVVADLRTYSVSLENYVNVLELYKNYTEENLKLNKELMDTENDTLVNQRKTYYHDQEVDGLKVYYYYIIFVIYAVSVICFAVFSVIYDSVIDWKKRIALLVVLVFLPFLSTTILKYFIYIVYMIYDILPKNVYNKD